MNITPKLFTVAIYLLELFELKCRQEHIFSLWTSCCASAGLMLVLTFST